MELILNSIFKVSSTDGATNKQVCNLTNNGFNEREKFTKPFKIATTIFGFTSPLLVKTLTYSFSKNSITTSHSFELSTPMLMLIFGSLGFLLSSEFSSKYFDTKIVEQLRLNKPNHIITSVRNSTFVLVPNKNE